MHTQTQHRKLVKMEKVLSMKTRTPLERGTEEVGLIIQGFPLSVSAPSSFTECLIKVLRNGPKFFSSFLLFYFTHLTLQI